MKQFFLYSGRLLAEAERLPHRETPAHWRTSSLYFCERCGEVYATVILQSLLVAPWQSYRGHCERCPKFPSPFLPGSIWREWDREFTESLPEEVLRKELEIHLKFHG